MTEHAHVFLNPDGSRDFGLLALVRAETGVTYAHRCGGVAHEVRELEGFAVPLGGPDTAVGLMQFFRRFGGYPPEMTSTARRWSARELDDLADLVAEIPCWRIGRPGQERLFLALDGARLAEITDAWIPVLTPHGPGALVFLNCD